MQTTVKPINNTDQWYDIDNDIAKMQAIFAIIVALGDYRQISCFFTF